MSIRAERLRSHRLTAPARTPVEAASHMLAVQSQEFWGGRWALAARTRGAPTLRGIDAEFARGELVRAWTMRGTLHIIPAQDLAWVLQITGPRQRQQAAGRERQLGIDADVLARAEKALRHAIDDGMHGPGLTRDEAFAVLERIGIDPRAQRGVHILGALTVNGVLCQGPVVPRSDGVAREQIHVLVDRWIPDSAPPDDPLAELFRRYIKGHEPATAEDFAWWAGLTLSQAREAAARAASDLIEVSEGRFSSAEHPRRAAGAPRVLALPPFDEYYISYVDRSVVADADARAAVGPGANGMVRPVIVADGQVIGVWKHSTALGRHADAPQPDLFDTKAATAEEVDAALLRYARFVTG
ncbi:hypothetical protein JOD62_000575 [Microbacterium keratanolyticum]|uniref:Winged helix DNA-binding domain-containing protein n=1 Tax=Microbacterium keratanolyticum TaxID=67574 RepID=A0A9W6HUS2_9MICO|nr:winged helix DNA-binding domain-containing protein [Microbacterium keratanolyticum]MBM7468027.1 hypothetical protein [Microbacterium keratanolyticum]GLK03018.1 hypothetical protein GCM10017596_27330 [Microbacterium keratanolyticum]